MKILSIGNLSGKSNTCLHRHWALSKCGIVDAVNTNKTPIDFKYRIINKLFNYGFPLALPDKSGINAEIKLKVKSTFYDIVWIDKGLVVNSETLNYIKETSSKTKIVSYSPDNMALRHNQSFNYLKSIPFYDFIFTTKSYIIDKMKSLGAKNVIFVNNSYESQFHFPRKLTFKDINYFGGDVGFVGSWEKERCDYILHLVDNGIGVKVFGGGKWNEFKNYSPHLVILPGVFSEDYSKALQAFKISLCFLRKINFDLQTTRSIEIPACGGFMLGERTIEHRALFIEDKEAVFFDSKDELLTKCKFYLKEEDLRSKIARAGHTRCIESGYSNEKSISKMVDLVRSYNT